MGHRLTIAMQSWRAEMRWAGGKPTGVELTVDVDSLEVLSGEGGLTPLAGPEKGIARSNALKSLDVKKFPQIRFTTNEVSKTNDGYRLTGSVEIHGTSRPQSVDVTVDDRGDAVALSAQAQVTQTDFGVKPYSLMMGALKVADEVTIDFSAAHPK
jgi:polyisoprenoid-binding protein YceI